MQEVNRNRFEVREIEVYDDFYNINKNKFNGIEEIVKVTRSTYWKNYNALKIKTTLKKI